MLFYVFMIERTLNFNPRLVSNPVFSQEGYLSIYFFLVWYIVTDVSFRCCCPVIDAEYGSAAYTHKQMAALEQSRHLPSIYPHPAITDSQVAHARLNKQGHRPLGRTQSAPLPLGHPMLTAGLVVDPPPHHQLTHNLLRQVSSLERVPRLYTRHFYKVNSI